MGKPFHYPELAARIGAVLRRSTERRAQGVLQVGELRIDPVAREVRLGERKVELSAKEFALLRMFAAEPTRVFTKVNGGFRLSVLGQSHEAWAVMT